MESAQSSCTDSDTPECSVCSELFTEPKLLPCAHILCRLCLVSWLSSSKEAHCPLCRAPVVDASHKVEDWEKVVDAIPTDISMARLVRSKRVLSESHDCKGCQQTQAVSICLHCGDMLCHSCTSAHGNLTATWHHKVEDLSTMTAERMSVTQPATCGNHTDKPSELYCPTHRAAICHLCASSEHRACPEVTLFEKHIAELYKELASMSERLKSTEEKMNVAIKELDRELDEARKRTQETLAEINAACNRLDLSVRECRKRLEKLTKKSLTKIEQSLQASRVILSDRRGRLRSHRRVVDRIKRCAASGDLDEASLVIKKRIEELDLSITSGSNLAPTYMLTIDQQVVSRLVKELSFLGEQRSTVSASSSEPCVQSSLWRFLDLSKDVMYSEDCLSAEKVRGPTVIVLSQSPMRTNMLYEFTQLGDSPGSKKVKPRQK